MRSTTVVKKATRKSEATYKDASDGGKIKNDQPVNHTKSVRAHYLYDGVVVREVGGSPLLHGCRPSPPIATAAASAAAVVILGPTAESRVFRLVGWGREREPTLPWGVCSMCKRGAEGEGEKRSRPRKRRTLTVG